MGWHGVDLDRTMALHDAGRWHGPGVIGAPIAPMIDRIKDWLDAGEEVRVVTARVSSENPPEMSAEARIAIEAFCLEHIGLILPVTSEKDYQMWDLWDDRAVPVIPNEGSMGFIVPTGGSTGQHVEMRTYDIADPTSPSGYSEVTAVRVIGA